MRMRAVVVLIVATALTACAGGVTPLQIGSLDRGSARVASPGVYYLYVAAHTPNHVPYIKRFPLHDGIPSTSPDLTYENYGGFVAVAGDGTVYAADSGSYSGGVFAFSPGQTLPSREIDLPNLDHCFRSGSGGFDLASMATDSHGDLYLGMYAYFDAKIHGAAPGIDKRHCEGVWVYSPHAHGHARPVQVIPFTMTTFVDGLAVDSQENLYVMLNENSVEEYSSATTNPQLVRTFPRAPNRNVQSITTDAADNLYIGRDDENSKNGRIDRYTPTGDPRKPASTIELDSQVHLLGSIAALSRHVFVDDNFQNVDVYHAFKRGPQQPVSTLSIQNVDSIAVGP